MASMWKSSTRHVRVVLRATSRQTSRNRPVVSLSTLALCTIVSLLAAPLRELEGRAGDPLAWPAG